VMPRDDRALTGEIVLHPDGPDPRHAAGELVDSGSRWGSPVRVATRRRTASAEWYEQQREDDR
jgi:hypothetical protein